MRRRHVILSAGGLAALAGCTEALAPDDGDERLDESGPIEMVIDGDEFDLTRDRFQAEHADDYEMAFHLHEDSENWYMEGTERVTVAEGVDMLPEFTYDEADGAHVVTVDGTEYDGTDSDVTVEFLVDGEAVDPTSYELQDGDELLIEIATEE